MQIRRIALAVFACLSLSHPALAGKLRPHIIVVGQQLVRVPDATAKFGCELASFDVQAGLHCYGPAAIRAAYGVQPLLDAGFTGTGQTIVIIEAFGSPTLEADLALFDAVFELPPPPAVTQIHMRTSEP